MEKNEECLKRFARASRTDQCYWAAKAESGLTDAFFPTLKPVRGIARAASARARLRLAAGDHFTALGDIDALLRCANHLAAQPSVIQYLGGLALRALVDDLLLLASTLPDAPNPQMVLSRLQRIDGSYPKPIFLLGEQPLALGYAQGCLRDQDGDGRFDRMVIPPNEAMPEGLDMPQQPPMTLREIVDDVRGASDAWRDVWTDDYEKARALNQRLMGQDSDKEPTTIAQMYADWWGVNQLDRAARASRNGVRLVLALHAYRQSHGDWPPSLDAGIPKELAEFRLDPFSGKDLVYRLENGQPLLYSVSRDSVDDGGARPANGKRWADDGDAVFWPPNEKGGS